MGSVDREAVEGVVGQGGAMVRGRGPECSAVDEEPDLDTVVVGELARGQRVCVRAVEGAGGADVQVSVGVAKDGETCRGVVRVRVFPSVEDDGAARGVDETESERGQRSRDGV